MSITRWPESMEGETGEIETASGELLTVTESVAVAVTGSNALSVAATQKLADAVSGAVVYVWVVARAVPEQAVPAYQAYVSAPVPPEGVARRLTD